MKIVLFVTVWFQVPTWHEVEQANGPLIALNLSKAPNFDEFYDLLVSSLKILKLYDRLTNVVGADEQTFLDELKVVSVRIDRMSVGQQPAGNRRPWKIPSVDQATSRPPPPPPRGLRPVTKASSIRPPQSAPVSQRDMRGKANRPIATALADQVRLRKLTSF